MKLPEIKDVLEIGAEMIRAERIKLKVPMSEILAMNFVKRENLKRARLLQFI